MGGVPGPMGVSPASEGTVGMGGLQGLVGAVQGGAHTPMGAFQGPVPGQGGVQGQMGGSQQGQVGGFHGQPGVVFQGQPGAGFGPMGASPQTHASEPGGQPVGGQGLMGASPQTGGGPGNMGE